MTNLEALKAIVGFPLDENSYKLGLTNRSLIDIDTYTVSSLKKLELAKADCLSMILSTPTIVEGGMQLSHSNKGEVRKEAERLYLKWGEKISVSSAIITDATNQW